MPAAILLPADPMRPRRVDEHFAAQAAAAREAGARVALLDHGALLRGDAAGAARRVPDDLGPAWYRGWMIPPDRYAELPVALCTDPVAYRTAHELPGWYATFAPVTPASVWLPLAPGAEPTAAQLAALAAPLGGGPAIVKDYVKSRKHEWAEACFVPGPGDLHRVATTFLRRQGDFLAGGLVVRAFEEFTGAEARVWWLDGAPVLTGPHPDTPGDVPVPPLDEVAPLVKALGCRFVTTDLAQRRDGGWRVVEVGDGQVSDLPSGVDPALLYEALVAA